MKHFNITEWANFVRGVEVGIDVVAMDQHLSSGCSRCGRMVAALRTTSALVSSDAAFEPPPGAFHRAQKILASRLPEKVTRLDRLVPRLIYDSLRESLPAGVRGRPRPNRQVLYQTGDFYVDLQFEEVSGARQVRLAGQVVNRTDPASLPGVAPILLKAGTRTVRRVAPNEFQEFQIEYTPKPGLRLVIPIPGVRQPVEIPLEGGDAVTSDRRDGHPPKRPPSPRKPSR